MKMKNYQPMTKKQLAEVIECYAPLFPGWGIVKGQVFSRSYGPIVQHVGIETLSYCAYRPWSGIRYFSIPTIRMLHQFLDIKYSVIRWREHPRKWEGAVAAMKEQFKPSILKPLDLSEIKYLCEQEALERTNDLCMLAILSAYLGEKDQTLSYCERIQNAPSHVTPRPEWELKHQEFGRQLRQAIEDGREKQFLDVRLPGAD